MARFALLCAAALALGPCVAALKLAPGTSEAEDLEGYTFENFNKDFQRQHRPGTPEYKVREEMFRVSLAQVRATNAQNRREGRAWRSGLHPFMDWSEQERQAMNGYKPSRSHARHGAPVVSLLDVSESRSSVRLNLTDDMDFGQGPSMREQGDCGSCWAISAVEAVEAQLLRNAANTDIRLSPQALVDCVPNPNHCGGTGGCDGATGELAYAFMRDHGIPLESDIPYRGSNGECLAGNPVVGDWPSATRAVVSGWAQLPSNQYEPLQRALVERGPAVVAVDATNWFNYKSGIFDGCGRDSILNHAVLLRGYGKDDEMDSMYWLIQNSWGQDWGEQGTIRLIRRADEAEYCGIDRKPQDGVACDGGPSEIKVCGACGLLYDPLVPEGVRLVGDGAGPSSKSDVGLFQSFAAADDSEGVDVA